MPEGDQNIPSSQTIKLIVDNSNLELEKRMSKSISETLSEQNQVYMTQIINITKDVTELQVRVNGHNDRINSFKGIVATVSAISAAVTGLVSFFIAQIAGKG